MENVERPKIVDSFFSIPNDLVLIGTPLPYDLFINSSVLANKEKFVRIFPIGGILSQYDIQDFKRKYASLYVREEQRNLYLMSLASDPNVPDEKKTEVIKSSAITYLSNIFTPDHEVTNEVLVESIKGCRDSVEQMVEVVQGYSVSKIQDLIGKLSYHDFYTYDHSINVSMYNIAIFRMMEPRATREQLVIAGIGGLLHDLGKLKIPTNIINNPGKLSDEEFGVIKKHPLVGGEILEEQRETLTSILDVDTLKRVVTEHHENYDGTGYPNKIAGKNIHVLARITALADYFDAITTKRSYHEILSTEEALLVLTRSAGKKLDPDIFDTFKTQANRISSDRSAAIELPADFDPCQPHSKIEYQKVTPKVLASTDEVIGTKEIKYGAVKKK